MQIRLANQADTSFIFNSYLKSLQPIKPNIKTTLFYKAEHSRMEWLLNSGLTIVMTEDEDDNHIIGWCNALVEKEKVVFTYVYVKHPFRGNKFAKELLNSIIQNYPTSLLEYAIYTPAAQKLIKEFNLQYNPYIWDISNFIKEND